MCFTCAIYTDLPFLITNEIPRMWLNYFKIEYPGRLQKWFSNCKLLMWWQNFPKLWCRYESFIIAYEIPRLNLNRFIRKNQEGYRNRLSKTALEFENCKKQLFTLTMCVPARLWRQIARTPSNCTITVRTLLAKYFLEKWLFSFDRSNMQIFPMNITRVVWPQVTNVLDLRYFCEHNPLFYHLSLIPCRYWNWQRNSYFLLNIFVRHTFPMSKSSIKTKTVLTMTDMTQSTELQAFKRPKDGYKVTVKISLCICVVLSWDELKVR